MATAVRQNPWRDALDQALDELSQAEQSFEWADLDHCDYHIFRIQAAEAKIALILRQARTALGYTPSIRALATSSLETLRTSNPRDQ